MTLETEPVASARSGPSRVRRVQALVALAVSVGIPVVSWDNGAGSTSLTAFRVFLVLWAISGLSLAVETFRPGTLSPAVRVATAAAVLGAGLASTAWGRSALDEWWQLWLSVPLVMGHVGLRRPRTAAPEGELDR